MMTSAFAPHPGGVQHPGIAHGQPIGPGQVPHPSQPLGQPMMHPGVSGPAVPHVSQPGPMVGLQPGVVVQGVPNAHAMSHLAPNAQMIQPQTMANNPMMQQQMQQHQHQHQHQQMQQMQNAIHRQRMQMQMHQQNNAMGMGVAGGGLSAQQMAAMRANGVPVSLPPHLQLQQAAFTQNQAMQAAQQAAAQQAQHQHQQNLAGQQHHLAMQHATSQGSNQGQPTPQSQPGGPQAGAPNRPPTSMSGQHSAHPSPAQPPESQQGAQPGPQQSQPPQQPTTSAPQMQPSQAQAVPPTQGQQPGQQVPQPKQQGQQPGPQAQGQQGTQQQAQPVQNQQQAQAQQAVQALKSQAQAQNATRQLMQQRQAAHQGMTAQQGINGMTSLKIFNFADKLGEFRISDGRHNDISFWQTFVAQHFTDDGTLRMILQPMTKDDEKAAAKTYEVGAPSLPRYFWTQYDSQVDQIQILLDGLLESNLPDNYHSVKASRSRMIYWFKDGTELVWNGTLSALYLGDKMENLTFETRDHQQFIPRNRLEELCAQASPDQNKSPRMTKKSNPRNQQRQPPAPQIMLPPPPVSDLGVTPRIMNFLEISETISFMKDIMYFAQDNPRLSVSEAMNVLVHNYKTIQQQNMANQMKPIQQQFLQPQQQGPGPMNVPPGVQNNPAMHQMQQGTRTPNTAGMQGQFMSPAMQNSLLPSASQVNGSPRGGQNPMMNPSLQGNTHTSSPAQSHMAAPMVPQRSQQGSASGASTSTSPNTSNKRRRSTQIGVKDEDGGSQPNGTLSGATKVKQSPRMGSNTAKRVKGS